MELHTFAYTIGIIELLIFIPMLVSGSKAVAWMQRFVANDLAIRSLGGVMVIIGVLVLVGDWSIGLDPAGLIRLVAWATLIKGLFASWKPNVLKRNMTLLSSAGMRPIISVVGILIGVLLIYGAGLV
ncbi:hypothetical protein KKF55_00190 [Patescibacteria group bacterium]|nr:hypothetical protein [Patescibacteria group bacterium]